MTHGIEDVMLQLEREKTANERQLESTKKQLESELNRRSQLEKSLSTQKAEVAKLKDHNVKVDRELNKALKELKSTTKKKGRGKVFAIHTVT